MFTLLSSLAFAADPPPAPAKSPSPTRVTVATADVHLELADGFVKLTGPTGELSLRGPMQVDLYDGWALVRMTDTGQIHAVPRERLLYVGTNNPDLAR